MQNVNFIAQLLYKMPTDPQFKLGYVNRDLIDTSQQNLNAANLKSDLHKHNRNISGLSDRAWKHPLLPNVYIFNMVEG